MTLQSKKTNQINKSEPRLSPLTHTRTDSTIPYNDNKRLTPKRLPLIIKQPRIRFDDALKHPLQDFGLSALESSVCGAEEKSHCEATLTFHLLRSPYQQ